MTVGIERLRSHRQMAIYCCQRVCGYAQQEVADCFSLTHRGSVSSSVRVIEEKIERIGFKKRLNEIEEELNLTKPSWLYI